MSQEIHLAHNVSVLMYHFVCPAKYRKVVFEKYVDEVLKDVCLGIEDRYDIHFLERRILVRWILRLHSRPTWKRRCD